MDYSQSAWWTCHSLKGWDIEDSCFDNMQKIQCLVNKNVMKDFLWKIMKFSGLYFEQQWTCTVFVVLSWSEGVRIPPYSILGAPNLSWNYMIWIVIRPSKPRPSRMTFNFCLAFIFNNNGLTWSLCVPYHPKWSGCPHTASWGHPIWPKFASCRSWSVFQEKIKT